MTQPHFTLSTEPVAVLASVAGLFTVGTPSSLVLYSLRITGDSHRRGNAQMATGLRPGLADGCNTPQSAALPT